MASTRPNIPVMHCASREYLLVYELGNRLITQGLYVNTSIFPTPVVSLPVFETANASLGDLITQAKGNTLMKKNRNAQCIVVFNYLEQLLLYVKQIANHDITIIDKSGFDSNTQPEKAVAPETPVIKKVLEGRAVGTYKIILERKKNKTLVSKDPKTHPKNVKYSVETTVTPTTDDSWVVQLEGVASNKLIFTKGLVAGRNYIRVYGYNSAGQSPHSAPFPFTPQL